MKKFKKLNKIEYLGLISLLKEPFPWLEEQTCGTTYNNLKEIQNTITDNSPNSKYCMLGGFGLTDQEEIILQFWDYATESEYKLYSISFRDAKDYLSLSLQNYNAYLKKFIYE
tara:strand:- start:5754 stop:6092 length:339 start_codon:yes stop_codon:yes gene_type:complete